MIDGLSTESIDFEAVVILIEDPNVSLDLSDESRRTLIVRLLIDAVIFDRLSIDQFSKVYECLNRTSGLSFTSRDIIEYFSAQNDSNIASKLVRLITRDVFKCSLRDQIHLFNLIQCDINRNNAQNLEKVHTEIADIAEKDPDVMLLMLHSIGNIIECDYYVLYGAICKDVFAANVGNFSPDLSRLCMNGQRCVRPKPGSKCSKLVSITMLSVVEGISREEYDARMADAMKNTLKDTLVGTPKDTPVDTLVGIPKDKTAQIEAALNIIEMVSNDIAALSLEAERINTCVRDAKAALM
jgi:hypothetical protein